MLIISLAVTKSFYKDQDEVRQPPVLLENDFHINNFEWEVCAVESSKLSDECHVIPEVYDSLSIIFAFDNLDRSHCSSLYAVNNPVDSFICLRNLLIFFLWKFSNVQKCTIRDNSIVTLKCLCRIVTSCDRINALHG